MSILQYVGMDVHKETITIAVMLGDTNEPKFVKTIANDKVQILRFFSKLKSVGDIISCYEAGCLGFKLQRDLHEFEVKCLIIAPGNIIRKPADKIKTDKRDAINLARLLKNGEVDSINIPSEEDEATRDFLRARDDLKIDLTRNKQRLIKFLLRYGYVYDGKKNWTIRHNLWLRSLEFKLPLLKATFDSYYFKIKEQEESLIIFKKEIEVIAKSPRYIKPVATLRCFKGVDYLTALSFVCEIGDFRRFKSAKYFMAFLGLVPREYSSGSKRKQGSITKTGNSHLRKLLIEASWHYRYKAPVSKRLTERRIGQSEQIINFANRALKRLQNKFVKLVFRGKPKQIAVTGVARELAGFIWGAMTEKTA